MFDNFKEWVIENKTKLVILFIVIAVGFVFISGVESI